MLNSLIRIQQSNDLNVINILWWHYNHTKVARFRSIKTSYEQLKALNHLLAYQTYKSQRTQQGECLIEKLDEINTFFPPRCFKIQTIHKSKEELPNQSLDDSLRRVRVKRLLVLSTALKYIRRLRPCQLLAMTETLKRPFDRVGSLSRGGFLLS